MNTSTAGATGSAAAGPRTAIPGLWRGWLVRVTAGELAGFTVPAAVGALTAASATAVQLPALVAAGAVEGAVLGAAQASVLRRVLPGLSVARFAAATAGAAALAYLIAMVPVALGERLTALPLPLLVALGAVLGAALLATIGTAQWLVLRRLRSGTGFWVPLTGLAWALGLGVFTAVATPLWQEGQPLALTIAIGVLGGLGMAATVAVITGAGAVRLARSGG
jgi:hypothetical protein